MRTCVPLSFQALISRLAERNVRPLTSTWTKHENLYCHSYAYKDGGHWFSEPSVGHALQRCADDSGCAGIGEWHCGDGQYRYCGKTGWGLGNYGAGTCTWEKPDQ